MMQYFTQLIQQIGSQSVEPQGSLGNENPSSNTGTSKEQKEAFAATLMGLLGMNKKNINVSNGLEETFPQEQTEPETVMQNQLLVLPVNTANQSPAQPNITTENLPVKIAANTPEGAIGIIHASNENGSKSGSFLGSFKPAPNAALGTTISTEGGNGNSLLSPVAEKAAGNNKENGYVQNKSKEVPGIIKESKPANASSIQGSGKMASSGKTKVSQETINFLRNTGNGENTAGGLQNSRLFPDEPTSRAGDKQTVKNGFPNRAVSNGSGQGSKKITANIPASGQSIEIDPKANKKVQPAITQENLATENKQKHKKISNDRSRFKPVPFKPATSNYSDTSQAKAYQAPKFSASELEFVKLSKVSSEEGIDLELKSGNDKGKFTTDEGLGASRSSGNLVSLLSKTNGRRDFSAQIAQRLQNNEARGTSAGRQWNHHRFVLDDGNTVNVAVRQADGVLQLQLSAGNSELNKIIQQHLDEIRQHLQNHMKLNIDLDMQNFGGHGPEREVDLQDSISDLNRNASVEAEREATENGRAGQSVRYLGFNNNEWTA